MGSRRRAHLEHTDHRRRASRRIRRDRRCIHLSRAADQRCNSRHGYGDGKLLWSRQIYQGDSFIVGCEGEGRTENCPEVVGPDWDIPMSPCSAMPPPARCWCSAPRPGTFWRSTRQEGRTRLAGESRDRCGGKGCHFFERHRHPRARVGRRTGGRLRLCGIERGRRRRRAPGRWRAPLAHTAQFRRRSKSHALRRRDPHPGSAVRRRLRRQGLGIVERRRPDPVDIRDGPALRYREFRGGSRRIHRFAGPTVAGGMLFVGSGYGVVNESPGNVLLAFGLP